MADDKITLLLEIEADKRTGETTFKKLEKDAKDAGESAGKKYGDGFSNGSQKSLGKLESSFKGSFSVIKGFAIAASAAVAAVGAAIGVGKLIAAANQQEDAVNTLNSALIATGKFSKQASQDIQAFASSLQETTRFGDEAILQNAALIQSLGNLDKEGLKGATKAALDLSSALRIDLGSAATLVGKAAAGQIESFSRYGVVIRKGATDAETFANALTAINSRFGGAAQRDVVTFSGALAQLSNAFGDIFEELGSVITNSPQLTAFIKATQQSFLILISSIKESASGIGEVFNSVVDAVRNSVLILVGSLIFVSRAINGIIQDATGLDGVGAVFGRISTALTDNFVPAVGLVGNIFGLVKNSLLTGFQTIYKAVLDTAILINDTLAAVGVDTGFSENLALLSQAADETLIKFANDANNNIGQIFNPETYREQGDAFIASFQEFTETLKATATDTESGDSFLAKLFEPFKQENIDAIIENTKRLKDGMSTNIQGISKEITDVAKKASFDLGSRLGNAIAGGIQNVVNSLLSGQDAFGNFAKFILGVVGDLAIQLGTFFIIQGIAVEALKSISGAGAVAAGAALVALGSLLKGLSGGAGAGAIGGGGVGAGAGGAVTQDNAGGSPITDQVQEREQPSTQVALTINGDVLDSDETGLRIVNLINKSFQKDGVVIKGAAFA